MDQKHTAVQLPKLLDQVRDRLLVKHDSIRTEQVYPDWMRCFMCLHGKSHPIVKLLHIASQYTCKQELGRYLDGTQGGGDCAAGFIFSTVFAMIVFCGNFPPCIR